MKRVLALFAVLFLGISSSRIASAEEKSDKGKAELISKENSVDSSRPPADWRPATVGQELIVHDRLRTGEDSRAAVRFGDSTILRLDELTEEEILPPQGTSSKPTLDLKQGSAYFFSREKSRELRVQTPAANGAIRGTEFVVTVDANGATSFTIIDGEVEISNSQGSVSAQSGERAEIPPGGGPAKAAVTEAIDSAQWCFYYPGILDLNDLALSASEQDVLRQSLSAYAQGDILRALEEYPRNHVPASPGEKVYRAGLFLIAGQVRKAQDLLQEVDPGNPGRQALSTLIAAVTLKEKSTSTPPQTATEWIAESYYRESKSDLAGALQAAERAANLDANSGFAWTRVAESQFNEGRVPQAKDALEKGLNLGPRNPAAHALRGFILSAENNLIDAKGSFETAIALDSALGDGWLGRGLCLIKQGHLQAGWRDLLTAAALEPNRAIFRRYLSEYFSAVGSGATIAKKGAARRGISSGSKLDSGQPAATSGVGWPPGGAQPPQPPPLGLPVPIVGVSSGGSQPVPTGGVAGSSGGAQSAPSPTPPTPGAGGGLSGGRTVPPVAPSPSIPSVGEPSGGTQPMPTPVFSAPVGVAVGGAKAAPTPTPSPPQIARKKPTPGPGRTLAPTPSPSRVTQKKGAKSTELTANPRTRRTSPTPRPTRSTATEHVQHGPTPHPTYHPVSPPRPLKRERRSPAMH